MKKILYNIASIILIIVYMAFTFYCIEDYQTYEMSESILYAIMSIASAIIITVNFIPKRRPSRK